MQLVASARVDGGKLLILNRRKFDQIIATWKNCPAFVTVERAHATRSLKQNNYYNTVVVPRCAAALKQNTKVTHELLKAQFLPHDRATDGTNGTLVNGLVLGGSTTKLNKLEFIEYLEAIVMWAAEKWDAYIPDPDPLWREHAMQEKANAASGE